MGAVPKRSGKSQARRKPRDAQLSTVAYEHIRQMIVECDLAPGAPVSQPQLEAATKLGTAAVRTALARLQQEGLVQPVPRQGYLVAPVTPQHINDLFGVRLLLEPAALRLAAPRLTDAGLQELERLAVVGYNSRSRESERRYLRANRDFHMIIANGSGNARLAQMMEQVFSEASRMLFITMSEQSLSDNWQAGHLAMCAALRARDGEAAAQIAIKEVEDGRREIFEAVLSRTAIARTNVFS